jgi:hypothetical protein
MKQTKQQRWQTDTPINQSAVNCWVRVSGEMGLQP